MGWIAENLQKLKENISFLVFWGAWEGAVTRKSGLGQSWEILGHFLACCARFSESFCAGWREDGRKMGEVGAKLAASCDQDGP